MDEDTAVALGQFFEAHNMDRAEVRQWREGEPVGWVVDCYVEDRVFYTVYSAKMQDTGE